MKRYFSAISPKRIALKLVFAYLALLLVLFIMQRSLLYVPSGEYFTPEQQGIQAQELHLPTAEGKEALAWFLPPPEDSSGKLVVFFHGNSGSLGTRTVLLEQIRKAGFGYLALEYPGYPGAAGKSTEESIYDAARAAMNFAKEKFAAENIVLLGRSLGSAVAVQMATEYDIGLLALVSPFDKLASPASGQYWYVPAKLMLLDKYDSISKISNVTTPLMVFHGDADTLVPYPLGQALFEQANEPKEFFTLEGQGHNRVDMEFVLQKIGAHTQTKPVGEILLVPSP